jgi:hypothetical protein
MFRYRIYLLTRDNHIASAPIVIACENDQVAVQQSQKFLDGNDLQLWQGRRLVIRLKVKPDPELAPSLSMPPRTPRPHLDFDPAS